MAVALLVTAATSDAVLAGQRGGSKRGNLLPRVSITSPLEGAQFLAPAAINLTATASDQDGSVTRVDFYLGSTLIGSDTTSPYAVSWPNVAAGTYLLKATAWDDSGASNTTSGRTISVLTPKLPVVTLTPSTDSAAFVAPATVTLNATATATSTATSANPIARVDFYWENSLLGTDTTSPYSFVWSGMGVGSYAVRAVATDLSGLSGSSPTGTFVVVANTPPSVSLVPPSTSYVAPASMALAAAASDADGSVTQVAFYAGTTLLGSDTTSPYSFTWTNVTSGSYAVKAVAHDNKGATSSSPTYMVSVGGNTSPSVALTSPANGGTFTAPASIALTATASDTDGTVAAVEFYSGTTLIGSDTISPYSLSWASVPAGSYSVTAVARDDRGAMTVSSGRDVLVSTSAIPSTAIFAPSNLSTVESYVIDIYPAGADPSATAPVATQNLGRPPIVNNECRADIRATVIGLSPGSYMAIVSAVVNGQAIRSSPSPTFTR
jgi:hypothetical protein